jgi:hypothetical protein
LRKAGPGSQSLYAAENFVSDHVTVAIAAKSLASEMNDLTEQTHDPSKSVDFVVSQNSVTSFKDDDWHAQSASLNRPEMETNNDLAGAREEPSYVTDCQNRATADVRWCTSRIEPEGASGDEVINDGLKIYSSEAVRGLTSIEADEDASSVNFEDEQAITANFENEVLSELNEILDRQMYRDETVVSSGATTEFSTSQQLDCIVSKTSAPGTTVVYITSQPRFEATNLNDGKRVDPAAVHDEREQISREDDRQFSDDDQHIVLPLPKRKVISSVDQHTGTSSAPDWQTNVTVASDELMVSSEYNSNPVNLPAENDLKHKLDVTGISPVPNIRAETGSRDQSRDVPAAAALQPDLRSSAITGRSRDATSVENTNNLRQVMFASRRSELVTQTISKTDENSDADDVILPLPKRISSETSDGKWSKNETPFAEQNVHVNYDETCERVTLVHHQFSERDTRDTSAKQTADVAVKEIDLPVQSSSPVLMRPADNSQWRVSPCDITVTSPGDVDASSRCSDENTACFRNVDDSFTEVIQQHVESFLDAFIPSDSKYAESSTNDESDYDANDLSHECSSNEEDIYEESPHQHRFYFDMKGNHRKSPVSHDKREVREAEDDIAGTHVSDIVSLHRVDGTEAVTGKIADSGRRSASPDSNGVSVVAATSIRSRNSSTSSDHSRVTARLSPTLQRDFNVQKLSSQSTSVAVNITSQPVASRLDQSNQGSENHETHAACVRIHKKESSNMSDGLSVGMSPDLPTEINVNTISRDKSRAQMTTSDTRQSDCIESTSLGKSVAEAGSARKLDAVSDMVKLSVAVDTAVHNQNKLETHYGQEPITRACIVHEENNAVVTVQPSKSMNENHLSAEYAAQYTKSEMTLSRLSEATEQSSDSRAISSSVFGATFSDSDAKVPSKATQSSRTVPNMVKAQSLPVTQSERLSPVMSRRGDSHDKVTSVTSSGSPISHVSTSASARSVTTSAVHQVSRRRTRNTGLQFLRQPKKVILVEVTNSSQPVVQVSRNVVEHKIVNDVARDGDVCVTNVTSATSTPTSSVQLSRRQTFVDTRSPNHGSVADTADNVDAEEFSAKLLRLRANLKSSQSRGSTVSTRFTANGADLITVRTKVPSTE